MYEGDFSPNVRPVPAVRARAWIRQGRVDEALAWVGRQGLSADDDLSYLHEFEHVTLARALVAGHAREPGREVPRPGDRAPGAPAAGGARTGTGAAP